jgi:AraC-like DNA-binding protein
MTTNFLVLLGGAGIIQSLFLSLYVLTSLLRSRLSNMLLLLLNLVIVVFLINTLYLYIAQGKEIRFMSQLALSSLVLVGPLTFFYVKAFLSKTYRFGYAEFIQLLPASLPLLLGLGSCRLHLTFVGGYTLVYMIAGFIWMRPREAHKQRRAWAIGLLSSIILLSLLVTFFSIGKICIISISIGFTVVMYTATYLGIRFYKNIFQADEAKVSGNTVERSGELFRMIEQRIHAEKLYQDQNLSMPRLAEKMKLMPHQLSFIINKESGDSFSDYINSFRLEEAKNLLLSTNNKVAAIAFDCGFNSLSSFYAAFKKRVGTSPVEFRKLGKQGRRD